MTSEKIKKGFITNVKPLKTIKERRDFIEALGLKKKYGLRNQLLFKLGITTGLRCGDIVSLKVETVKNTTSFKIVEGKTKKERTVYLNTVMADLHEYIQTLPDDCIYLFPSQKGNGHITRTQAYRILVDAGNMIGNDAIGSHTMRKTFGFTYYEETKDIATLMEIFNHSSQKITLRYIGYSEEQVERSIKSIQFY